MSAAANSSVSPTPILDRLIFLPPPTKAPQVRNFFLGVLEILCVCGFAALLILHPPELILKPLYWLDKDLEALITNNWAGRLIVFVLATVLASLLATVVHECGHLLAGLMMGFRFKSLRVWMLQIDHELRVSLQRKADNDASGWTAFFPYEKKGRLRRVACMLFAGPLANLISGYILMVFPIPRSLVLSFFILISFFMGAVNFLPFRRGRISSDGMRLIMLFWDRHKYERGLALTQIWKEQTAGVDAESISPDLIAGATRVIDKSALTVMAHMIAYAAAYNQHKDDEAGRLLEICLRHAGFAGLSLREALIVNAGVFQAERRKRVDLAKGWLAEFPTTPTVRYRRHMVEGAILEAEGDFVGALQKVDAIEAAIKASTGGSNLGDNRSFVDLQNGEPIWRRN